MTDGATEPMLHAESRARRAYELGRLAAALRLALVVALLPVLAVLFGSRPQFALAGGALLLLAVTGFRFAGGALGRSVVPGVVAGAVPLAFALGAGALGHVCTSEGCVSLCMPACAAGGAIAGFVVVRSALRDPSPLRSFLCMGGLVVLIGMLGCSCIGLGSVAGVGGGLGLSSLTLYLARKRRAR